MNLYFLVEGRNCERKLYPKWLTHLLPSYSQVEQYQAATENSYYLISGQGYPRLLDVTLPNAVEEVVTSTLYDYLVVVLDADDATVEMRIAEVEARLADVDLGSCKLKIIVQNCCIESWFLGNRNVFQRQPQDTNLSQYIRFYNVKDDDPELMGKPSYVQASKAAFHKRYLKLMLAERNIRYTEKSPSDVGELHYLSALQTRVTDEPTHLQTFQTLLDFCHELR